MRSGRASSSGRRSAEAPVASWPGRRRICVGGSPERWAYAPSGTSRGAESGPMSSGGRSRKAGAAQISAMAGSASGDQKTAPLRPSSPGRAGKSKPPMELVLPRTSLGLDMCSDQAVEMRLIVVPAAQAFPGQALGRERLEIVVPRAVAPMGSVRSHRPPPHMSSNGRVGKRFTIPGVVASHRPGMPRCRDDIARPDYLRDRRCR